MLNGNGNENGIKISRSNEQKNKFFTCSTLFWLSLPLFCTTTKPVCTTKTCRMCLTKILFPVSMFAFIFSLPGAHFHLAASISHFLTAAMKFSCFSSNEIRLLTSFSVIHVSVNIKTDVEKDTTFCFFFSQKVQAVMRFSSVAFGYSYGSWLSYFILVCLWCGLTVRLW